MPNSPRKPTTILRWLAMSLMLATAGQAAHGAPPGFDQVKSGWHSSEARLLDRHGELLQEIRLDRQVRRTEWSALAEISPALQAAVLMAEDRRFFEHGGVDWLAAAKAALTNWLAERPRGASTISQQTAKNLFLWSGRDPIRKGLEVWYTLLIETLWPKERILEVGFYLLILLMIVVTFNDIVGRLPESVRQFFFRG